MAVRANVDLKVNMASVKRSMDRAAREINKTVQNVSGKDINFNVNGKSFTQPLGRITASANEFTKSLEASNARVIAFGASVGIINAITDSFKFLVAETIRFEKTLQDINVVLNSSNEQIEKFGQGLFDVAQNTAQSFNIAADAALEFSRQGLSVEEVLKRTNDALTLTRITSLDAAEAVSGLTAAVNAFGEAGLTTTDIIDKLAAVDVKFAVSSEDLINGLERAGAVAIDAGVDLDNLVGIITSLQQTTARGGAVIGNGLKTIFTRIQRPESIRQLEDMGVAVRTLTGAVLPADKVLKNIAKGFEELSQSQQSNIVQFAAGIFQANIFRAALADLAKTQGIQQQATEISANAAGEAARKNELLNKSISAMASQAGSGLKELVGIMGELAIKPELGEAVGVFGNVIESLKNALGGGEEEGNAFAKGLVRGIGNVLTGPAAIAFVAIFTKLLFNVFKFASGSLKDVLGIVTQKEKVRQIEESIVKVLGSNVQVTQALNRLEGDRVAQEQYILGIIEAQTNALAKQQQLASKLGPALLKRGITPDLSYDNTPGTLVDIDGDGVIRSAGGLLPQEKNAERKGAIEGGYSPGRVTKMKVPGMGEVIYNTAEKVKSFEGMKQPAIMPPQSSRAGRNYKEKFSDKHGFDPYASGGLIPNFVPRKTSKGTKIDTVYQLLKNAWLSEGYRMTNKELTDATGFPKAPDNPYKEANANFNRDFGTQLNKAGYTVNTRPRTEYGQYLPTNKEKIAKFIQQEQDPAKKGIAKITDDELMDKFLKQKILKSASGHHFQAALEAGGRSKVSFANSVTSYRNQFVNTDKLVAPPIYLKDDSTYVGPPNSSPWADVSLEFKGESKVNATGKEIDSVFKGIKSGAPQSFLGLDKRFDINPLTKKELVDFKKQNFSANVDHYGFAKMQGNPPKPVFLSYNTLANAPYSLNANGFEHAISDFKRRKRGLAGSPLDFINVPGEAKFGPTAYKNTLDEHLTGKFLRHLIGTGSIPWPPRAGYGSLGRLEYFHTESFGAPTMKHIEQRNKQAHNIKANLGLIPSFADYRTRSEKIRDYLKDPANKHVKFKRPANITPTQISMAMNVPVGGNVTKEYSDNEIKKAISETIQKRKDLQLEGFENLDNVDVNSVLKKYKESIKDGKYYGNKDLSLSYSSGLVPNFVDKVQNGAIYYSKPHNKIVRVTRVDNDKKIARIKHHDMEKYKDEEVFFKDLEAVSAEQAKEYFQKKSSGLVPNFAQQIGNTLLMEPSKFFTYANSNDVAKALGKGVGYKEIQDKMDSQEPISIKASLLDIITSSSKNKTKPTGKETLSETFNSLASKGIGYIERDFIFRQLKRGGARQKKGESDTDFNERKVTAQLNAEQDIRETAGSTFTKYLSTYNPETKKGDISYPIDHIAKGLEFPSGETKSGEFIAANLISKSLRMASDRELTSWLKSQGVKDKGLNEKNLKRAQKLASQLGIEGTKKDESKNPTFDQIDADIWGMNKGFIPNFASTTLYRGTSPKYPKAVKDIPNPPQFLFDDIMAANTKSDFINAVKKLGISHSMGAYSGSYNDGVYPATIGQMRGHEEMDENQILQGGYVYPRPLKGGFGKQDGIDITPRHQPSGFVSRTVDKDVARSFAKSSLPGYEYDPNEMGKVDEVSVPNKRIFDQTKLEKYIDRFGLKNVKKSFKDGMRKGTLKDIYLNLHKFRPKVQNTDPLDMFSPNAGESERSIGMTDGSMTRDEREVTHIWSKRSPYFGSGSKGFLPNYARFQRGLIPNFAFDSNSFEKNKRARNVHDQMFGTVDSRTKDLQNRNQLNREKALRGEDPKLFDKHYPDPILGQTRHKIINAPIGGGERNVAQAIRASKRIENSKKEELIKQIGSQRLKDLDEKYLNKSNKNSHTSRLQRFVKQRKDLESAIQSENFEKAREIKNADFIQNEKIYNEYANYLGETRYLDSDVSTAKRAQERFGKNPHSDSMNDPKTLGYYPGITKSYGVPGEKSISYNPYETDYPKKGPRSFRSGGLIPNFSKITRTIKSQKDRVKGKGEFIGGGVSEGDKDIAFNMFDHFISKISGLSSSFGLNERRMSLTGTAEDRNLIETFKTSGKSEKDLIQIAGSQRKLKNILDGYMLGHFETLLLAKGKFKQAEDPLMQGDLSKGLVPNFAGMDLYRGVIRNKGAKYSKKDVFELAPNRQKQFASSSMTSIEDLKEYLLGHVDNQNASSLVSTSTRQGRAMEFATSKDSSKQGLVSKENMSFRRMYNPRKVEKLLNFMMDRKGWSEAKSVQWFLENAKNKNIGFHMKRWMDEGSKLQKKYAFEDEVALLGKQAFTGSDNLAPFSRGLIPNFANPLSDALQREKSAGVPSSRIRVEKSSQLKSPMNPMGLAVTNTRDEPGGLAQGIRRAKKQRIDPKKHGIDVPNFAVPVSKDRFDEILNGIVSKAESSFEEIKGALEDVDLGDLAQDLKKKFDDSIEEAKRTKDTKKVLDIKDEVETIKQKGMDKFENNPKRILGSDEQHSPQATKANAEKRMQQLEEATKELTSSIGEADIEVQKNTRSQGDNLVKLFALQSIISTTNGFLQEFAESTNTVTRTFAKLGTVASDTVASFVQIQMLGDELANFFESMGKKQKEDEEGGGGGIIEGVAGGAAAGGAARGSMFAGIRNMAARGAQAMQRFIKPVAAVVAGFKLVDGVFKNFISDDKMGLYMYAMGSASEKAAHRLELMSKSIEATTAAIENLKKQEENKQKIVELEIKGSGRTIKEDQELLDLRVKSYDVEIAVAKSMAELQKEANEGGFAMRMFSEATKKAGKSTLDEADLQSMLQQMKVFQAVVSTNETFANTTDSINSDSKLNDAGKSRGYSLAMLTRSLMDESQASKNEDLFKKLSQARGEPDYMLERMNFGLKEGVSQEDFRNVFKTLHDGLEESESFSIMDEDEAFRQAMKSFIDGFKKNDLSEPLKKLIQSNSEAIKELDRRVVMEKHLSKIRMSAAKHESSLSKIINKQISQRSKFLDEQNLIAKSTLLKEKQTLALADIENEASLSTTNAREKLNQAFLDVADKLLRTENLSELNAESLETALANLNDDLKNAGNKIKDSANTFEKINKGLDPNSQIQATDKDKIDAEAIVNATKKQVEEQLAAIERNPAQVAELQKIFTDLYSRLAAAKNENVTALVLSSLEMLKLNEEQIKKTRKAILEKEQEIDTANKAKAIAQAELSLQMESENLTAKTLEGNKTLYKILKDRITDSKTLAEQIQASTMFDMQLNDAKKEELKLRQEIINDLTAQAVVEKIGKNKTELRENQSKAGLLKTDVVSLDPSLKLDGELLELRETNVKLLADKVTSEYLSLSKTNKENKIQQALIDTLGLRKRIAEQKFTEELSSLKTQIQEKAARISLLKNDKNARNTLGQRTLINEIADTKIAELTSQAKLDAYEKEKLRLALAESQVQSELNELKSQRLIEETKFQVAANNGKLLETVQEELKLETSMLEKDAYLAALKSEQAQLLEGINERQKKAQELLDFSNKIDEARLAANKASMDQRALSGIVDADMQINRFNQRYDTRAAATQAINPNATAEDMLAFTEKLKEFNKTTNNGTEAIDALRVKMAEMQVSASNLKSDLVNTGIENLRTNMVQMFKDIGSGAKSVGDAYRDLGLGLAEAILDRMMQHNVDKIISNLTYAFTGVDPEQEANKFLLENNNAVSANTSALEKLRGQLMKGIKPEKSSESAVSLQDIANKIEETNKTALEGISPKGSDLEKHITNLGVEINDFSTATRTFVQDLSKVLQTVREEKKKLKPAAERDLLAEGFRNISQETYDKLGGRGGRITPLSEIQNNQEKLKERNKSIEDAILFAKSQQTENAFSNMSRVDLARIAAKDAITGYKELSKRPNSASVPRFDQNQFKENLDMLKVQNAHLKEKKNLFHPNEPGVQGLVEKNNNQGVPGRNNKGRVMTLAGLAENANPNSRKIIESNEAVTKLGEIKTVLLESAAEAKKGKGDLRIELDQSQLQTLDKYKNDLRHLSTNFQQGKLPLDQYSEALRQVSRMAVEESRKLKSLTATTSIPQTIEEPTKRNFWGGKIQRFAKGGLVEGPAGIDNVPAMLTAGEYVVPKEEVQNFSGGGRATRFFKGATQAAVMTITADAVNKAMEDQSKKKGPPVFDMKKMNPLALGSDVSLKTGDPRMSGRALAKSQEMQEYKDYLLEKAAYEVDKKNAKFKKRMGYLQQAMGFISSFAVAEVTDVLREPLRKTVDFVTSPFVKTGKYIGNKASDFFNGDLGFGEYSDAYQAANKTGYDLSYNQIKNSFETGQPIEYTTNQGKKNATTRTLTPQDKRRVGPEGSISYQPGNFLKVTKTRTFDDRDFVDPTRPDSNNMGSSYGRRTLRNNSGGKIPSMLTRGEGFIPSSTAKKIGYQNLESMNRTGSLPTIQGPSGIDKVGPVGLDEGDFIIRKSSTDKLMRDNPNTMRFAMQNPDGFRKSATGYYDGGIVGTGSQASFPSNQSSPESPKGNQPVNRIQPLIEAAKSSETEKTSAAQNNEITNNISVNVTIDSSGKESVEAQTPEGSYQQEQELAMKIKTRVLEVIREEKRLGGELDR